MKPFRRFIVMLVFCVLPSLGFASTSDEEFDDYDAGDNSRVHSLRFILGASAMQAEILTYEHSSQSHVYRPHSTLTAGFFFVPQFGLNGILAMRSKDSIAFGAEGELVPLRLPGFHQDDFFQAAVLVGFFSTGNMRVRREAADLGFRFSFNFNKYFGWANAVRANVSARNDYAFSMFESGLAIRFQ